MCSLASGPYGEDNKFRDNSSLIVYVRLKESCSRQATLIYEVFFLLLSIIKTAFSSTHILSCKLFIKQAQSWSNEMVKCEMRVFYIFTTPHNEGTFYILMAFRLNSILMNKG